MKKPDILLSKTDVERLEKLIDSLPPDRTPGIQNLEQELERGTLADAREIPPSVVTMNSRVRFRVDSSNKEFCLTLVYPKDVKADGSTVSILAPVGSALLGLSEGDAIEWPTQNGKLQHVRIEEILYQPERAGEYHR